jgi:hypothetical protein
VVASLAAAGPAAEIVAEGPRLAETLAGHAATWALRR